MDELDFLKQHWQKDQDFPKVNKEEIRKMLHKSSSSLVRWIFIISIIELFLGIVLNVFMLFFYKKDDQQPIALEITSNILDVASYIIILYFIYSFFTSYRKIKNTNSTKELLSNILITRKTVGNYIKFNIYLIIVAIGFSAAGIIWEEDVFHKSIGHNILFISLLIFILLIVGAITIYVIKFYYRIIYIRLVKKLDKNYEELEKLEKEEDLN